MNLGRILIVGVVLLAANAAYAKYERALDGKTKVWHNAPQREVQASWSGDRDDKGYATGPGTLTWFRVNRTWLTGSLLPSSKYIQVSQYTGKMVKGKLEGSVVSVDAKGDTYHAKFADGRNTSDWVAGPLPGSKKRADQAVERPKVVEAPAEAPPPAPKLDQHVAEKPAAVSAEAKHPSADQPAVTAQTAETNEHSGDSLQSLAMPPSSLRVASLNESSPKPSAPPVEAADTATTPTEPAPASAPASPSTSLNDDDARTVAALDTEYQAAVKTSDASTIDRILADDFVLVRGVGRSLSKADVVNQARNKQAKYEHYEVEEGTQKVHVWRDTAVVTETVWVKGSEDGKPVDQKMSVTATYVRTPNGWRYVAGQATPAK